MSMWKEWLDRMMGKEPVKKNQEIGRGDDGEMSADALKRWFMWSGTALGICLVAVCVLAIVSSARNKKESAVMEVDSGAVLELYLNRKGTILSSKGDAADVLEDHSLEEGVEKILQGLLDHGHLSNGGAVIFTLRPVENGISADLERFAEEIHVYAEAFLRKKHSNGTVYVNVLEKGTSVDELVQTYGVSVSKAALVKNLVDENTSLRNKDIERLLKLSVDEISAELFECKYETSFIVVMAKQVYALQKETQEAGTETQTKTESKAEVSSENADKQETTAAVPETEAEAMESTEAEPEEKMSEEETSEEADEETSAQDAAEETHPETQSESMAETQASITETTQAETQTSITETTQAETQTSTTAATQPETQAPTTAAQPETEPATPAPIQPETLAPTQAVQPTQPQGSIIEQVIPITPETAGN